MLTSESFEIDGPNLDDTELSWLTVVGNYDKGSTPTFHEPNEISEISVER